MQSAVFVQDNLLPLDFVQLGRLVTNVKEPNHAFYDPPSDSEPEQSTKPQSNVRDVLQQMKNTSFGAKLSGIFSAQSKHSIGDEVYWSSQGTATIQQLNSDTFFNQVCEKEVTRKWIEKAFENGRDVYMMVGFSTVFNANASDTVGETSAKQAELQLPLKEAAQALTNVPSPLLPIKNPKVQAQGSQGIKHARTFTATGTQVYAVQYRKLKFDFLQSKTVDNASLEHGSRWKLYWALMGAEEAEEDMIDVSLDGEFEEEVKGLEAGQAFGVEEPMYFSVQDGGPESPLAIT